MHICALTVSDATLLHFARKSKVRMKYCVFLDAKNGTKFKKSSNFHPETWEPYILFPCFSYILFPCLSMTFSGKIFGKRRVSEELHQGKVRCQPWVSHRSRPLSNEKHGRFEVRSRNFPSDKSRIFPWRDFFLAEEVLDESST